MTPRFALVGSRTTRARNARGEGITVVRVDPTTGALQTHAVLGGLVNPSFLCVNAAGTRVYTVHGDGEEVTTLAFDAHTGTISVLGCVPCGGRNPVHLTLDAQEKHLLVANHWSHNVALLPVAADGQLQPPKDIALLTGEPGPHRIEQPFSKPHATTFDPSGRYLIVPDKGLDKVFTLKFENGAFVPTAQLELSTREGAGPRHVAFHPHAPMLYVINELDNTVLSARFDAHTGSLEPVQVISALSARFVGNSRAAEIAVHPNGRTVYASNRGEDSIAVFTVDPNDFTLTLIQTVPSQGRTPRFFTLDPSARWLYALNEDSDSIATFAIDPQTGTLHAAAPLFACASPVCLVFVP